MWTLHTLGKHSTTDWVIFPASIITIIVLWWWKWYPGLCWAKALPPTCIASHYRYCYFGNLRKVPRVVIVLGVLVFFRLLWQTPWPKQFRNRKVFITSYTSRTQSIIEGSQGRNLKQKPPRSTACWLTQWTPFVIIGSCLECLLTQPSIICPRNGAAQCTWHQSLLVNNQDNPSQTDPQVNLI